MESQIFNLWYTLYRYSIYHTWQLVHIVLLSLVFIIMYVNITTGEQATNINQSTVNTTASSATDVPTGVAYSQ